MTFTRQSLKTDCVIRQLSDYKLWMTLSDSYTKFHYDICKYD